ncbi:MAG: alpha/beta hydrolase [Proteobacteria bacterium]|nr:MAG: alpha/beta hydrolase [Pseudomonadota bacterium]
MFDLIIGFFNTLNSQNFYQKGIIPYFEYFASLYLFIFLFALFLQGFYKLIILFCSHDIPNLRHADEIKDKVTILIHGTCAKNAPWIRSNSYMSKFISDYHEHKNEVHAFNWTGINSFTARLTASKKLCNLLKVIKMKNPNCQITLVGHSHGGSIALHAANSIYSDFDDIKVVCLGAPVLTRVNQPGLFERIADLILASILLLLPISYFFSSYCNSVSPENFYGYFCQFSLPLKSGYQFNIFTFIFVVVALVVIRTRISNKFDLAVGEIKLEKKNILQMRTVGDEASVGINTMYGLNRFSQLLTIFPVRFFTNLSANVSKEYQKLMKNIVMMLFLMVLIAFSFLYFLDIQLINETVVKTILLLSFSSLISLALVLLVFSLKSFRFVAWGVLSITVRLVFFPFIILLHAITGLICGPETALIGSWVHFSAESVPVGEWQLNVFEPELKDRYVLRHSDLYLRPRIINKINQFIWS